MDSSLVYAKTPTGDEAVRQSTRVVQRNLRMVLLQVDGNLSVEELVAKIGNQRLVEGALKELEEGGFIEVATTAPGQRGERVPAPAVELSVISQFSTFGSRSSIMPGGFDSSTAGSNFSSFGKPLLSSSPEARPEADPAAPVPRAAPMVRAGQRIAPARWLAAGLGGVLFLLLAVLLFYPYGNFRPGLEAALSRQLAAPVKVGEVRLELLPRPRLLLADLMIGASGEGRIAALAIASPHLLLGSGKRQLPEAEASGVSLSANRLVDLPIFGGQVAAGSEFSLQRLRISRATVMLGDLASTEFSGEMLFRADGSTEKASFRGADDSLRLEVTPTAQGVVLAIESLRWKPAGMPFSFDSLQASGLLQKNRLLLQKVDTTFLGGILKGNWLLDWNAGMVMAGEASLTRLDARKVTAALAPNLHLEGDLSGALRMRASGSGWQDMLNRIEANLDAEVARGLLTGVDLGELARRGSGAVVRAGATRFDTLAARLDIGGGRVVARALELDAGPLTAGGRATVEGDGRVDGMVMVQARSSVSSVRVPARLTGTLLDMSLVATN
ncbi:MAG TPA: AsmA-like C-terminal region-containing protein [Azonexus sp.]